MVFLANRLRETGFSKKFRNLISNWPSYQGIPDGTIAFRIKLWLRVSFSLLSALSRMSLSEYLRLYSSRRTLVAHKGKVLVIANGPSVAQLSRDQLEGFVSAGGKIFAMNGYIYSEFADEFPPDYFFLTDPDVWSQPRPNDRKFQEKLELLISQKWSVTTIVQPVHQHKIVHGHPRIIYLTHLSTSGLWPFRNPFLLWGLAPSTALLALAVAKKMGFERIYFAGLDGDSYRHFHVDSKGLLKWENLNHHFYSAGDSPDSQISESSFEGILVNPKIIPTIGDALYAEAILRRDFMRLSRGEFVNATPSKYFDLGIFGDNKIE
jgi:hypothetical protein